MDRKEVYTKVRKHLLTQMAISLKCVTARMEDTVCAYRSSEGLKCAIGCLIPESVYDPSMEGVNIQATEGGKWPHSHLLRVVNYLQAEVDDSDFLGRLQDIHDDYDVSEWEKQLDEFEEEFGL